MQYKCERCGRGDMTTSRFTDDSGRKYERLCAQCKIDLTFPTPEAKVKFERSLSETLTAVLTSGKV